MPQTGSADFDACYWIMEFVKIAHCSIRHVRYDTQASVWKALITQFQSS